MKEAKIQFSDAEKELLSNTDVILTKNKALEKVRSLLEELHTMQAEWVQATTLTSNSLFNIPGKISRGENYLGLPYLVLDYPRNFSQNIFAIRTMFWWGHSFSITLHLSGEYLSFKEVIKNQFDTLQKEEYFIGINQDQWVHHFEASNYKPIQSTSKKEFETILEELPHIKIAAKWPLENWHLAATNLFSGWKQLLSITGLVTT
jgi:hypothetical protein